ncbi:spore germination protein KA [Cytobacillus horneckiae]|uniref:Spore germination protein n=1 Tax=Cytobacillus horneckiae TaxID=549687 RepID=A0A2N0ZIJ3_9BACI|nr:spore germination protein [Cytobacillus horneckiae]MBN6886734.1 spore germination protein [Cytobacillus horneckiae]MCM3177795.1 spore germination protein [Cytobacillus horneckiae]MEC1157399.1 spore germination protein [Cytobacillus horneckiae]MED2935720.1 spore germination protein [Cytobacillus horneckiae]PKG29311.1 spore germination protein [Cytobacillus horneckiae]
MSEDNRLQKFNRLLKQGKLEISDLKHLFSTLSDITFITHSEVTGFYINGMIDRVQFNEYINKLFTYFNDNRKVNTSDTIPPIMNILDVNEMMDKVFSGTIIFYKTNETAFYGVDISKVPQREPEESKTEVSLKGPRDGFTEELDINISLIRKRLKTGKLSSESFEIGSLSQTKITLLYLNNKAESSTINEARERIKKIEAESIVSSGQLEQWISDHTFSLFPLLDYITRPDFAVECLLRGRFIIIVDGSPSVLIGPMNLFALLKSPEDVHFPFYIVAFQRLLRVFGLFIAIFSPAMYVAITNVNVDQVPFSLLATIVMSRQGLPLSLPLESFLVLLLFELLREAGIRMPTAVGQTISIVGGLIIGDAAIRAGLASPTLLVVAAVAAVATYTLVNQSLTGTVTILRIYTMLIATFFGVYGFALSVLSIIVYLTQLESFKLSYLAPLTSLSFKEYLSTFLTNPFRRRKSSTKLLQKRSK